MENEQQHIYGGYIMSGGGAMRYAEVFIICAGCSIFLWWVYAKFLSFVNAGTSQDAINTFQWFGYILVFAPFGIFILMGINYLLTAGSESGGLV
jgi:hypothetical protein